MEKTQIKPHVSNGIWLFFLLTFVITILSWGVMAVLQIPGGSSANQTVTRLKRR